MELQKRFRNIHLDAILCQLTNNKFLGAAFATKSLMEKAEAKIKPQLPKLVPKLYRSSYDPNPKISQAMTNILNALVDIRKMCTALQL